MEAVKNTANSVTDTVKGATDTASKEANKNVAKDSNASAGTRAEAATDAVGDKTNELKHKT
ncbi:Glucose-repressible protein [Bacidia gigantensis]|uniref:Glucose-repressible protein n=1 Tax=Bacidia gigantensis TaxID=2732470 RepID=UPI001D05921B|nr:Glucose-repressible protein [Bacidia gigantensis]KAG8528897.1 Glucose-repressible protein [Bacidia gigantensis]